MDEVDKKILDRIQSDFPLEKKPFESLSEELGVGEEELINRIRELLDEGYIRRIGPIINSRKIGMVGTLVAVKVSEDRVKDVADFVSQYSEVSHNYRREHDYNVWFTISAESRERIDEILDEVSEKSGVEEIIDLPSKRMYKIGVSFSLAEE
ncbi:Lrp/AsnC family transcriptional regulator [archaeon SCG-AAA382B04]|nr:Lrp/AsnC family transcriptional regulator [archaeon SCG-AAA382B04]